MSQALGPQDRTLVLGHTSNETKVLETPAGCYSLSLGYADLLPVTTDHRVLCIRLAGEM